MNYEICSVEGYGPTSLVNRALALALVLYIFTCAGLLLVSRQIAHVACRTSHIPLRPRENPNPRIGIQDGAA